MRYICNNLPLWHTVSFNYASLAEKGISAAYINHGQQNEAVKENVVAGKYRFVYISRESILGVPRFRDMLLTLPYQEHLVGITHWSTMIGIVGSTTSTIDWAKLQAASKSLSLNVAIVRTFTMSHVHTLNFNPSLKWSHDYHMKFSNIHCLYGCCAILVTLHPYTVWTRVSCQAVSPTNGLGTRLPRPWCRSGSRRQRLTPLERGLWFTWEGLITTCVQ